MLTPLGLEYDVFGLGIVKPLGAHLADIGAAALKLILGDPVSYVGPPHNRQVDTTALRLPDRTPQPTAPAVALPSSLAGTVSAGFRAMVGHALALGQRATDAVSAAEEVREADALKHVSALEEQQQQARAREEAMRVEHAHELEQQRAGAAVSRAVLEQHLAAATAVAIAAKAVADIATEEQPATAAATLIAEVAVVQRSQSLACQPRAQPPNTMHQYTGRFKRLRCLERCHTIRCTHS